MPNRSLEDLSGITQIDWARLAAFVDGEGHIGIVTGVRGKKGWAIKVTIANSDLRLMSWLKRTFGGCISLSRAQTAKWKTGYQWISGSRHAFELLKGIRPFLLLKYDQADVAFALQETMKRRGPRGTPKEIIEERHELKETMHQLNRRGPAPSSAETRH